jgi:predicted regulator of Ras-like GTPase activity (Roadblock/LC7/MglB family)
MATLDHKLASSSSVSPQESGVALPSRRPERPASPPSRQTPPSATEDVTKVTGVLNELLRASPEIQVAAVISAAGEPIASGFHAHAEESRLGAISAALLALAEQTAVPQIEQVCVQATQGCVVVTAAGGGRMLVALTGKQAMLGFLRFEMRKSAARIASLMDPPATVSVPPPAPPLQRRSRPVTARDPSVRSRSAGVSAARTALPLVGLRVTARLREWLLKRGLLYVLTQAPMVSFLAGYLWQWTSFATATVISLGSASLLLPLWVRFRRSRSNDPQEPVFHLAKYAAFALVPVAIYDLVRIPNFYLLGNAYWDRWFDFGSQLTGGPSEAMSSLVLGTLVHYLQGYVLGLGFYILFDTPSLRNAMAYLWVFLSVVYSAAFTLFAGSEFSVLFVYDVWWNHFWMAIAAWMTPIAFRAFLTWGKGLQRRLLVPAVCTVLLSPFAFAFLEASLRVP